MFLDANLIRLWKAAAERTGNMPLFNQAYPEINDDNKLDGLPVSFNIRRVLLETSHSAVETDFHSILALRRLGKTYVRYLAFDDEQLVYSLRHAEGA